MASLKPLPVAPLTPEDQDIWFDVIIDLLPRLSLLGHLSKLQDRCDADLMLRRENFRQQCTDVRAPCPKPVIFWFLIVPGHLSESV
jgi:hypothetical protein